MVDGLAKEVENEKMKVCAMKPVICHLILSRFQMYFEVSTLTDKECYRSRILQFICKITGHWVKKPAKVYHKTEGSSTTATQGPDS